jgi:hypothetical protein
MGTIPVAFTAASGDYQYDYTGTLFTAGQSLSVTASGATVPAFGLESVVAPPPVTMVSPADGPSGYSISLSANLPVVWSGGQPGAVLILEGVSGTGSNYFYCEWDASTGKQVVPQPVLTRLGATTSAYLVYGQYTTTNFVTGPYTIAESALVYGGDRATLQ